MRAPSLLHVAALAAVVVAASPRAAVLGAAPTAIEVARALNEAFVDVADKATPSVVVVQVAQKLGKAGESPENPFLEQLPDEWRKRYDEWLERQQRDRERFGPRFNGEGSGIIYREDGHILTNAHVVEDAESVRVKLHDGRQFEAEVRGMDPESDIAILRLKEPVTGLKAARFGNSDKVRVGEFAIAIGAPFELEYSVTFGHISAKGRAGLSDRMLDEDFLQTDANINPGNSGGPLVNLDGEVVGVNSMIRGVGTGICFAIPANLAREVADQLVETGRFRRSWLGVNIVGLREDEAVRKRHGGIADGVVVTRVLPGGPAARAKLVVDDVILSVDTRPVATVAQLRREITRKRPGSDVKLAVHRSGKAIDVTVQPDPMPDADERVALSRPGRRPAAPKEPVVEMGLTVQTVDTDLAGMYQLGTQKGVVVVGVDEDGPLAEYGLKNGDLIYEVAKKPVQTASQFAEAIREAAQQEKFTLRYQRSGEKLSAVILNTKSGDNDR